MRQIVFLGKILLFVLSAGFCFIACEREIDLNLPEQNRLVVFSNFTPDSLFKIHLSTTIPLIENGDTTFTYPENAKILLYEDGSYLSNFIFDRNISSITPFYSTNITPTEGRTYSIEVEVPDYPKVTSHDVIPEKCTIERHELQEIVTIQDDPDFNLEVYDVRSKIKIQVEEGKPQYFHLRAWRNVAHFDVFNGDTIFFQNFKEDLTPTFRTRVEHIAILHEPGILFDSKVFETKPDGITLNFQVWFSTIGEIRSPIYLEVRNVSEDYYRFHKSVGEQEFAAGRNSLLHDRTVLIHNNIEGGIGNFGGYNVTLDSLRW